jgi:glucose uptake protein
MIILESYGLAVFFFVLTMICWGSWANTQKMAEKTWRFELYYIDFALGFLILAIVAAFTLGTFGSHGRPFLEDIKQAEMSSIMSAFLGGIVWNLGNLLLVAAIAVAGMSVGFPIGGGIAWILGITINYMLIILDKGKPESNPFLLWGGVAVIIAAIILSMFSYRRLASETKKPTLKGILLSVSAGLLIAFFYGMVVRSIDNSFIAGGAGNLIPYSGVFFFAWGGFLSTFIFIPVFMRFPVHGERIRMRTYWKGSFKTHVTGILGGFIFMFGMVVSFMSAGAANPDVAYALSNAAPVVAILWGIFVWKEFEGAPKGTNTLLIIMFICYLIGLALITYSRLV